MGLSGQEGAVADVDLEMDVDRALDVKPWVDAAEFGNAIRVGPQCAPAMAVASKN